MKYLAVPWATATATFLASTSLSAHDGPDPLMHWSLKPRFIGGGGGGLETPGPFRPPFSHLVSRGHHYAMAWINGSQFSYKAYDLDGKLFDTFTLEKAAR